MTTTRAHAATIASGLALAAWLALPRAAAACATCFGDPDSPMVHGMNNGILLLLGCVGLVYLGIGKVFWELRKRAKRMAKPELRLINGGKR